MKSNLIEQKPIVFVKIGGSLITDKIKPFTLKEHALEVICEEIKTAMKSGKRLIVGHGAGSFAHVPAKKYQTHKGIINEESYRGMAEVADMAAQLNRIVIKKLLEMRVNAVSVSPLSTIIAENHIMKSFCTDSIEELLRLGLLPVLYGDQILDTKIGCTVYSTEKILGHLAIKLKMKGYLVERIIHCGQTNGVYDRDGNTIPLITGSTIELFRGALGASGGVDVTGGMIHKVEETLALAQQGIPGLIIDGIEHGSLSKAVMGDPVVGTRIEA
ncbi:hypothetical protein A2973_02625 [Candidatus Gottesmanbacteria bacterium RIFCSPLOWO2_01_FULL_49_10]|uniref:Isopentenyl phosphate kinase n=1 Tax=Candidatus Gottesmanbacteria bacterium RIFCSPLOWO2_01_FULL_49_10 TaxID=1798396 RepID=A0A1F6B1W3_9BACT|nr:MAG: hypothetical protein UY10_C0004G0015 [Microgenomates group bacterium GW2011_GWA2_47_8]OGG30793.1 MAG: hypothetical protein A2973_02625 [Candidatus Gottesmanbacteria bacterium RIFCSPLOWO2_01_FULL_49_10]